MTAIEKILNLARKEIGTIESPANSNNVIYNTAYYGRQVKGAAYAWCATFCVWLIDQADLWAETWGNKRAAQIAYAEGCPNWVKMAKATGRWITADKLQAGDFAIFDFSKNGNAEHIGIVEKNNGAGSYITIEGNTSSGSSGSQSNGGGVFRRTRYAKDILGGYRPNYKNESEEKEMVYNSINDVPDWGRCVAKTDVKKGYLNFPLNESILRSRIASYRQLKDLGIIGKDLEPIEKG